MEIAVVLRSEPDAFVSRRGAGQVQELRIRPGRVWLCPIGVDVDFIRFSAGMDILHFYLDPGRFDDLSDVTGGTPVPAGAVRYLAGLRDDLIRGIGGAVVEEMRAQSSGGRVLIESLAHTLTVRLAGRYAQVGPAVIERCRTRAGLDDARHGRVLDYMASNVEADIGIEALAAVACLSPFHFIRMFRQRTGLPPHRYLSRMRLERAKTLLADGSSVQTVSDRCRFSSTANFTRAFRRATGTTPAAYRAAVKF